MDGVGAVLLVGGVAALVAVWGVVTTRAVACRRATLDHIARAESDRDLILARQKFIELAKGSGTLAVWADESKESAEETQAIRLVLNELELLSIGIQRGIIDFELIKRWNRSSVMHYWNHAAPFIHALRARTNNPALFHEFEELRRWMEERKMPRRNRWRGKWL